MQSSKVSERKLTMAQTNELLVIPNYMDSSLGYLFLIMTGIMLFYLILSVEVQKARVAKLKKIAKMIEAGHKRVIQEESRQDAEQNMEQPQENTATGNHYGNQYLTRRMRQ